MDPLIVTQRNRGLCFCQIIHIFQRPRAESDLAAALRGDAWGNWKQKSHGRSRDVLGEGPCEIVETDRGGVIGP